MSQAIRKLKEGDKVSQQQSEKIFKDGNRNISFNLIQKNANQNVQAYIDNKSWGRRKKQAFMEAYSDMLSSIDKGDITERDSARRYIDSSGRIKNSEGRSFDAYGEAAHFLDTIVDAMPDYKEESKKKEKYDSSGLYNFFKKKAFGGNDPDLLIWQDRDSIIDKETGKRGITNRANYFADIIRDYSKSLEDTDYDFEGSAYIDKSDLLNRLKSAEDNLRTGEQLNNEDLNSLIALGLDGNVARLLFSEDPIEEKEKVSESEQYLIDSEQKKRQEELDKQAEILRRDEQLKEELTKEYLNPAKGFLRRELVLPNVNYDSIKWGKLLDESGKAGQQNFYRELENYLVNKNPFDNQNLNVYNSVLKSNVPYLQHLANNLYSLRDKVGIDAGDGYYYLPYTINKNNGTVILYNPTTNTIVQEAISKVPNLWNKIQNDRRAEYINSTFNFGEGGIIKFQNGGYYATQNLDFVMDDYKNYKAKKSKEENTQLENSANKNKRTIEQEKAGQRVVEDWTGVEKARLGAAAADVASIVASFVPGYGTAASAALGLGSTLTNLGADIADDSISAGDTAWNAILGLGMDVVGLIPGFGAAGKSGKIVKNLVKLTPKLLTIWGASQSFAPAVEALKKINDGKDLTVDDWKALSMGLSSLAGISRMGTSSLKANAYKSAAKTGDRTIKVKSGERKRITPEQLEKLQGKKDLTSANKYLKGIKGFENDELEYSFNRGKNPFKKQFYHTPEVGDHYDFSFYRNTKDGNKPFGSRIDERIYKSAVNSEIGIPILKIKSPNWNPYKINKTKESDSNKSSQKVKGLLNSPRYFRLKEKGLSDEQLRKKGIYKQGGIIKAQYGTNTSRFGDNFLKDWKHLIVGPVTLNQVDGKPNTYGKVTKGTNYKFDTTSRLNSALDLIKSNKATIDDINMMQRRHAGMYAGYNPEWSPIYNEQVKKYQTDYQNYGLNDLIIAPNYNNNYQISSNNPNSGDSKLGNWVSDGRYDQITDDRRILARKEDYLNPDGTINQGLLNKDIEAAKAQGYNYNLDNQSGYYMLSKIPENKVDKKYSNNSSKIRANSDNNQYNFLNSIIDQAPNFISAGRLAGNIINNNKVTQETLKGLKPLILNTYNLQRPIYGDLATKQAYYNRASQLESLAGKPRTSDASLQLASELEAKTKGNELRAQGDLADNEMIRKTAEQAWQVDADNIARRTDVSNRNRASILGINKSKHDVEAARKSANWVSIENFLKEKEYKELNKSEKQKDFEMQLAQDDLYKKYYNTLKYNDLYKKAIQDNATQKDIEAFQSYERMINQQYKDELNKEYARLYGLRFKNKYSPIYSAKTGGSIPVAKIKAKTESAKMFQENIENTVKSHLHMIDNLSNVTKELIIKSMTI